MATTVNACDNLTLTVEEAELLYSLNPTEENTMHDRVKERIASQLSRIYTTGKKDVNPDVGKAKKYKLTDNTNIPPAEGLEKKLVGFFPNYNLSRLMIIRISNILGAIGTTFALRTAAFLPPFYAFFGLAFITRLSYNLRLLHKETRAAAEQSQKSYWECFWIAFHANSTRRTHIFNDFLWFTFNLTCLLIAFLAPQVMFIAVAITAFGFFLDVVNDGFNQQRSVASYNSLEEKLSSEDLTMDQDYQALLLDMLRNNTDRNKAYKERMKTMFVTCSLFALTLVWAAPLLIPGINVPYLAFNVAIALAVVTFIPFSRVAWALPEKLRSLFKSEDGVTAPEKQPLLRDNRQERTSSMDDGRIVTPLQHQPSPPIRPRPSSATASPASTAASTPTDGTSPLSIASTPRISAPPPLADSTQLINTALGASERDLAFLPATAYDVTFLAAAINQDPKDLTPAEKAEAPRGHQSMAPA